ncbi:MAG: EpsG family protein [Erysipelotrichaceae bacterium]|nr:EpsG family protein [Erysipelotrichaceae bacterium]
MEYYLVATLASVLIIGARRLPFFRAERSLGVRRTMLTVCFCAMVPLLLISSLRWNVGTDTWHTYTPEYLAMKSESMALTEEEESIMLSCYKQVNMLDNNYTKEQAENLTLQEAYGFFKEVYHHTAPGFQAIEKFLVLLKADVQWLYFITSLIILSFVFLSIYTQSSIPELACLLFVITGSFFQSLNIVSQYIAISICLFACTFAEKQKPVPFILLILLACLFHKSAIIYLPVYFLPRLHIRPIWCVTAIAALFVAAPVVVPLLGKAIEVILPQYATYFSYVPAAFEWIFFALGAAVLIAGTYYYDEGKGKPYYRLWFYSNVLGMLALCFSGGIPLMKRINFYFAAPHFLFLPLLVGCEKNQTRRKLLTAAIVLLFIAETVVAVMYMNKNGVLPYQTFLQTSRFDFSDLWVPAP